MQAAKDFSAPSCAAPTREGAPRLAIRQVDPTDEPGWDALVLSHPDYTFFHSAAWARVLKESYGFNPIYLVFSDDAGVVGILPLMEARSCIRGTRGVSLPFTDECAPLWFRPADASVLVDAVLQLGRARGWKFWEVRGGRNLFGSLPESTVHSGHVLHLNGGAEALFARFDASVRRAIRKSERSGVHVEISREPDALRQFYRLHCLTRGRHGVPPQPFSFFQSIQKRVIDAGHGFITVARIEALPVAASVYFHLGRRAIYKFGASDLRSQHLRANNLVMWTAIQHLAREGFATLDFGRTDPLNSGLRAFKLGWGTAEIRLPYYRYDFRSKTYVEKAGRSRWTGALSWLPGPFARLAGALLYPHWE